MKSYNSYETALKTTCITQQPVFFHFLGQAHKKEVWHRRLGNFENNGRNYDVYEFDDPITGKRDKMYFDITCFLGRVSLLMEPKRYNFPTASAEFVSVRDFFGPQLIESAFPDVSASDKEKLNTTILYFEAVPSSVVANFIAIYNEEEKVVEVFPYSEFHQDGFPMLHGFHFYILFVIHQLTHFLQNHDLKTTEVQDMIEWRLIKIGQDCISFIPSEEVTFADNFVKHLLGTHKPSAFENENEQKAFQRMVKFALSQNLFTKGELFTAISNSKVETKTQNRLTEILNTL